MNNQIRDIERKFLNFSLRKRNEHPAVALNENEREVYALYLESKGQDLAAESFRSFKEDIRAVRKKASIKLVEAELYDLKGKLYKKVEIEKGQKGVFIGKRNFYLRGKKVKTKFYESLIKVNV